MGSIQGGESTLRLVVNKTQIPNKYLFFYYECPFLQWLSMINHLYIISLICDSHAKSNFNYTCHWIHWIKQAIIIMNVETRSVLYKKSYDSDIIKHFVLIYCKLNKIHLVMQSKSGMFMIKITDIRIVITGI